MNIAYNNFCADETGAVTVDWVVLAGAVIALGLGVLVLIEPGVDTGATKIANRVGTALDFDVEEDDTEVVIP